MPNKIFIPYRDATDLLQEGDVLLYTGKSFVAWWIRRFTRGEYTHVGAVSRPNGHWEVLQTKEFHGAVIWPLERDVKKYPGKIDVYRPRRSFEKLYFDPNTQTVYNNMYTYPARKITDCMRKMSGRDYGYGRIILMWLNKVGLMRNRRNTSSDHVRDGLFNFVCSTALSRCMSENNYDIIPNQNDNYVDPNMIARSALLDYLFTLTT